MPGGKKWTESQATGAEGEDAFQAFARRMHMIPHKSGQDVGLDFFCQPTTPDRNGIRSVSGHVVGACVRATKGKGGRIGISRADAEQLLKCSFPVLVAMVDLREPGARVFARFVDGDFGAKLARFLRTEHDTLTLTPRDLTPEDELSLDAKDLDVATGTARLRMVSTLVREVVPSARLEVRRSPAGQFTLVEVPRLLDGFEIGTAADLERVEAAIFGAPAMFGARLSSLRLKKELGASLDFLSGPVLLSGGLASCKTRIVVDGPAGRASCPFESRRSPRRIGYVHSSGLSLTISERTQHEGRWVHFFESDIDAGVDIVLEKDPELWSFLEKCVSGASISEEGGHAWPIERFDALVGAGFFAGYLRAIARDAGLPVGTFLLKDALEEEDLQTMLWVSTISADPDHLKGFGFHLSNEKVDSELEERFELPVVTNSQRSGIVSWLASRGRIFVRDGAFCGLRVEAVEGVRHEVRPERFSKTTEYPEAVVFPSLPSIRFAGGLAAATEDASGWGLSIQEFTEPNLPPSAPDNEA